MGKPWMQLSSSGGLAWLKMRPISKVEMTWGELLLAVFCTAIFAAVAVGRASGDEANEETGGLISTPIVLAMIPVSRNGILNIVFGVAFERALYVHRLFGRLAVAGVLIHGSFFLNELFADSERMWGTISAIGAVALFVTSLGWLRRHLFNVFMFFHLVATIVFLGAGVLHEGDVATALVFTVIFNVVDWLFRANSMTNACRVDKVELLPGDVVRLSIGRPDDFEYEAGQYAFLMIPSLSPVEWHPFSFASHPEDKETIVVCIRLLGNWTRALIRKVEKNPGESFTMYLDGPYGRPSLDVSEYDSVLLISGGIGITPMQSLFNSMVCQYTEGARSFQKVMFVWSVRDKVLLEALTEQVKSPLSLLSDGTGQGDDVVERLQAKTLDLERQHKERTLTGGDNERTQALQAATQEQSLPVAFQPLNMLHRGTSFAANELQGVEEDEGEVTPGVQSVKPMNNLAAVEAGNVSSEGSAAKVPFETLFYLTRAKGDLGSSNPSLRSGRPPIASLMETIAQQSNGLEKVAVMTCGPDPLVASVYREAAAFNRRRTSDQPRMDVHSESFAF